MKNDLEEKRVHGSLLFPFQYYTAEQGRHGRPEIFVACHWHDDVEILTVAKGTLQIMVDGRELRGEEGDIFFFNSGQIHQIQGNGFENDYYSFVFSMKSLDFRENDYTQTTIIDPIGDQRWFPQKIGSVQNGHAELLQVLEELRSLCTRQPTAYQLLIKANLYRVLALLEQNQQFVVRSQLQREHSTTALRLKEVLRYVAEHYQEHISLEQAAEIIHMSPKYFSNYFSETFHVSFVQYLNRYLIEQSCILLQTTPLSVMEVGFQVGYGNFSYFIRRFREFYGCTPSDYRKRL